MNWVSKLYRNPAQARQVVDRLLLAGFKAEYISVLGAEEESVKEALEPIAGSNTDGVECSKGGRFHAAGGLGKMLSGHSSLSPSLAEVLRVSAELSDYYEFGISSGGVLVAINAAGPELDKARAILRQRDGKPEKAGVQSPGFREAGRMSGTNPVDATMTGDFRKY